MFICEKKPYLILEKFSKNYRILYSLEITTKKKFSEITLFSCVAIFVTPKQNVNGLIGPRWGNQLLGFWKLIFVRSKNNKSSRLRMADLRRTFSVSFWFFSEGGELKCFFFLNGFMYCEMLIKVLSFVL